jgi:hypothetical protein
MAQKTLFQIIQTVAAELNLPQPSVVVSSQDQNVLKLLALARAVCDDLLMEFDWQALNTRYSFSTTTGVDNYALPAGIGRFINGTFFDANNKWPMQGPKTPTEWEWIKASSFNGGPFTQFRIYGDKFYVSPVPGATPYTFNFEFVSSYYVKDSSGTTFKPDFTVDSDICVFDHRTVVYGVKLKWRESIAQDTTTALADYNRALEFAKGQDSPAPKLNLLGSVGYRMLSNANIPDTGLGN